MPLPESRLLLLLTQPPAPGSQLVSQLPSLFASIHSPCSSNDGLLKTELQNINWTSSLPCLRVFLYLPTGFRTESETLPCTTGRCVTWDCGFFQPHSKRTPPAHANPATLRYFQFNKLFPTQDRSSTSHTFSRNPPSCPPHPV